MSKKTQSGKSKQNYRNDDEMWDKPRHKVKAIRQNKDARYIEQALKRKDYKMLAEEY